MDVAVTLLILWALLFMPLGLVVHWFVLGVGAHERALPLAPLTGIAAAMLVLASLSRVGIDAGDGWVAWAFVGAAIGCGLLVWRMQVPWRSRELVGCGLLLLLAMLLVQLSVIGGPADGPLGYGTRANPVDEIAAIEAAAGDSSLEVVESAQRVASYRPAAFEQFAALTVTLGRSDEATPTAARWTSYSLHSGMTGLLAALVALPLFAFARARGVRRLGLVVLVPLGVLAPASFVALANGAGASVAAVPLVAAASFSLLVTGRDRGWWVLALLYSAAVAACAGIAAVLPILTIAIAWQMLRSRTYEHLSQHDEPRDRRWMYATGGVVAALGIAACASTLRVGGLLLVWTPLHDTLGEAVLSWPFSWLDSDLSAVGPSEPLELLVWLIGPALLVVAAVYAMVRNERRELAVLVGVFAALIFGALLDSVETETAIRAVEFTLLTTSPLLAALAIRAVALARANADVEHKAGSGPTGLRGRLAGVGPTLLVVAFTVLSFAATSVTGTRMVHAPALAGAQLERGNALIAAGDPWLAFVVDGDRVDGGYADADSLFEQGAARASYDDYDKLVLSGSPLASDPNKSFVEQSALDAYQARLFHSWRMPDASTDPLVDTELARQRRETANRDNPDNVEADADAELEPGDRTLAPVRHDPVEGLAGTPPDQPAGLLLPHTSPCPATGGPPEEIGTLPCRPDEPAMGAGCLQPDLDAVRSSLDGARPAPSAARRRADAELVRAQLLALGEPDQLLPDRPNLLGVQCFDVPLDPAARLLLVHLRDVGIVLPPESATRLPKGAWTKVGDGDVDGESGGGEAGGVGYTTSTRGASMTYGSGLLSGRYDVVLEGEFGAGVTLVGAGAAIEQVEATPGAEAELGAFSPVELRGSADGFGPIQRDMSIAGAATVANRAGTDIDLRRMFARPRDMPSSCDVPIPLQMGQRRELQLESAAEPDPTERGKALVRPALTVAIVAISGTGEERSARVAVGSYMSRRGVPRHVLVDWTEQYDTTLRIQACDGTIVEESGVDPLAEPFAPAFTQGRASTAFGALDG